MEDGFAFESLREREHSKSFSFCGIVHVDAHQMKSHEDLFGRLRRHHGGVDGLATVAFGSGGRASVPLARRIFCRRSCRVCRCETECMALHDGDEVVVEGVEGFRFARAGAAVGRDATSVGARGQAGRNRSSEKVRLRGSQTVTPGPRLENEGAQMLPGGRRGERIPRFADTPLGMADFWDARRSGPPREGPAAANMEPSAMPSRGQRYRRSKCDPHGPTHNTGV